jgi:hypothetical protein
VRPTFDVYAIAEITSFAAYAEFLGRLRKLGFQEDARKGAPLCRWLQATTTLDVMPLDEKILGFSNMWYRPAMDHAEERELAKGLKRKWSPKRDPAGLHYLVAGQSTVGTRFPSLNRIS